MRQKDIPSSVLSMGRNFRPSLEDGAFGTK